MRDAVVLEKDRLGLTTEDPVEPRFDPSLEAKVCCCVVALDVARPIDLLHDGPGPVAGGDVGGVTQRVAPMASRNARPRHQGMDDTDRRTEGRDVSSDMPDWRHCTIS